MQMSGTSNVCRKLQIMLEEQRGLLSAGEAQRETAPAAQPLPPALRCRMAEIRGLPLPGSPLLRLWILHYGRLPPWLPASYSSQHTSGPSSFDSRVDAHLHPPPPVSHLGHPSAVQCPCLSCNLPCCWGATERAGTELEGRTDHIQGRWDPIP